MMRRTYFAEINGNSANHALGRMSTYAPRLRPASTYANSNPGYRATSQEHAQVYGRLHQS